MRVIEQTFNPQIIFQQQRVGERLMLVKVSATCNDGSSEALYRVVINRSEPAPRPDPETPAHQVDFYL